MRGDSGATQSPWFASVDTPSRPPLDRDTDADVCIVGAGIAGLSTAYHLAREGRSVVVVDDGPIGGGQTGRTTAHLSNAIDDLYQELETIHGRAGAQLAAASHTAAIERIQRIVMDEHIACDFERLDGYLFAHDRETGPDMLERELRAAHDSGLTDVTLVAHAPLPGFDTGAALRFPRQGQFHSLKYQGRENPWARLYDPSRVRPRAVTRFVSEAANMAAQYADWVTPGEVESIDAIPAGEGPVVRRGLAKVAVFRDEQGRAHERSAVCPHLGCIVGWNHADRTWDCPCHGSRFDGFGRVVNGPAASDLDRVEGERRAS